MMERKVATAWAPASLSNLGPGFDALGAAIDGLGDIVRVERTPGSDVTVAFDDSGVWVGPTDAAKNTASVAAAHVASVLGHTGGLHLTIRKGLPAGTGLGSSAASSVAAAVATEYVLGGSLSEEEMMSAVVAGESATSGHGHADNVLPSLLGGFVLMRSVHPTDFLRISGWDELQLIIALPEAEVLTRDARRALPDSIPLAQAVDHASRLGLLVGALDRRDVEALGKWMMSDDIIVPARRHLWPYLDDVSSMAVQSGAAGCTVSGSGPAIVACCTPDGNRLAETIREAMLQQMAMADLRGQVSVHRIHNHGALILEDEKAISWRTREHVPAPHHVITSGQS